MKIICWFSVWNIDFIIHHSETPSWNNVKADKLHISYAIGTRYGHVGVLVHRQLCVETEWKFRIWNCAEINLQNRLCSFQHTPISLLVVRVECRICFAQTHNKNVTTYMGHRFTYTNVHSGLDNSLTVCFKLNDRHEIICCDFLY
jgi:hypothetical protein